MLLLLFSDDPSAEPGSDYSSCWCAWEGFMFCVGCKRANYYQITCFTYCIQKLELQNCSKRKNWNLIYDL